MQRSSNGNGEMKQARRLSVIRFGIHSLIGIQLPLITLAATLLMGLGCAQYKMVLIEPEVNLAAYESLYLGEFDGEGAVSAREVIRDVLSQSGKLPLIHDYVPGTEIGPWSVLITGDVKEWRVWEEKEKIDRTKLTRDLNKLLKEDTDPNEKWYQCVYNVKASALINIRVEANETGGTLLSDNFSGGGWRSESYSFSTSKPPQHDVWKRLKDSIDSADVKHYAMECAAGDFVKQIVPWQKKVKVKDGVLGKIGKELEKGLDDTIEKYN